MLNNLNKMFKKSMDKTSMMIYMFMFTLNIFLIQSTNNMVIWILMEINSFLFIYLLSKNNNYKITLNYFIFNSFSSLMVLICLILMNHNHQIFYLFFCLIMLKLGLLPFSSWPLWISLNISWINLFLLNTLQKLPLFYLIYHNLPLIMIQSEYFEFKTFIKIIFMISILTSFWVFILSLNEFNFKKLIVCSSLNHTAWMLLLVIMDKTMFMFYFSTYSISMLFITLVFEYFSINKTQDLQKVSIYVPQIHFLLMSSFLIIASVPPMLTFITKFSVLYCYLQFMNIELILMMIISSLFLIIYFKLMINQYHMNKLLIKFMSFYFTSYQNYWISGSLLLFIFSLLIILVYF